MPRLPRRAVVGDAIERLAELRAPELAYHCEKCDAPPDSVCLDVNGRTVRSHPCRIAWVERAAQIAARAATPSAEPKLGLTRSGRPRQRWRRCGDSDAAVARRRSKALRAERRSRGHCINHDNVPATSGVLCAPCRETHRRSA